VATRSATRVLVALGDGGATVDGAAAPPPRAAYTAVASQATRTAAPTARSVHPTSAGMLVPDDEGKCGTLGSDGSAGAPRDDSFVRCRSWPGRSVWKPWLSVSSAMRRVDAASCARASSAHDKDAIATSDTTTDLRWQRPFFLRHERRTGSASSGTRR
jgi:hypothetical protein